MVSRYKQAGYDFVSITDHNQVTADPKIGGILFVPGDEQSAAYHMSQFGAVSHKNLDGQPLIGAVLAAGGAIIINHPHYSTLSTAALLSLEGYQGIEIYNAVVAPNVANAEDTWDELLTAGKSVFGFACDDAHGVDGVNRAWVVVFADELTLPALVRALKAGEFYASTGPSLSITSLGATITAKTGTPSTIEWIVSKGLVIRTVHGATDTYQATGDEGYVRVRVTDDATGKKAWGNAIWVRTRR